VGLTVGLQPPRRVSVIVPSCDRPSTLREALASIRALEGSDLALEILVGDNGSNPDTRIVAEEFGAVHLRVPGKGASAARNAALWAAQGDYLAFLDDDDVWLPAHVRGHLAFLDDHPDFGAVVGQVVSVDSNLQPVGAPWPADASHDGDLFIQMMSGYFPQIGATITRTQIRESVGGFDESLMGDEDWDWHLRLARRHRIGFIQTPSVLFRQRPAGSFDSLQLHRLAYTPGIFFRHAIPASNRWRTWADLLRSYVATLRVYHNYFVDAAISRANSNQRMSALRAIWIAMLILPPQTFKILLRKTPLQRALLTAVTSRQMNKESLRNNGLS